MNDLSTIEQTVYYLPHMSYIRSGYTRPSYIIISKFGFDGFIRSSQPAARDGNPRLAHRNATPLQPTSSGGGILGLRLTHRRLAQDHPPIPKGPRALHPPCLLHTSVLTSSFLVLPGNPCRRIPSTNAPPRLCARGYDPPEKRDALVARKSTTIVSTQPPIQQYQRIVRISCGALTKSHTWSPAIQRLSTLTSQRHLQALRPRHQHSAHPQ